MHDPDTRNGGGYGRAEGGRAGGAEGGSGSAMPMPAARWVQWVGAASSVALILGVVVWGYRLAVRDVSGVPVIRALEGPARVAPENPGGDMAAHVGLAVNEVAGAGVAAPGPERVVLAPAPTGLAADDAPMAALRPLPDLATPEAESGTGEDSAAVVAVPDSAAPKPVLPKPEDAEAGAGTPEAVAPEAPAEPADPATAAAPAPDPATDLAADPAALSPTDEAIPATVPGISRSPRPLPRPVQDLEAEAAAQAVAQALSGPESVEIDATKLPSGTRVVQLGAFDSPELARAEWGTVSARFEALMAGKKRIVQEAASGGRSFWRLRVEGFASVEEARQFCAALVAEGANCIPTLIK